MQGLELTFSSWFEGSRGQALRVLILGFLFRLWSDVLRIELRLSGFWLPKLEGDFLRTASLLHKNLGRNDPQLETSKPGFSAAELGQAALPGRGGRLGHLTHLSFILCASRAESRRPVNLTRMSRSSKPGPQFEDLVILTRSRSRKPEATKILKARLWSGLLSLTLRCAGACCRESLGDPSQRAHKNLYWYPISTLIVARIACKRVSQ